MLRSAALIVLAIAFAASRPQLPAASASATTRATDLTSPSIATAPATPLARFARVDVAPSKTSIYVGSVSLAMPTFARRGAAFETTYVAKVVPYFFYNESGRLTIDFTDDMLRRLELGEPVEFTGRAIRTDGADRRVEGKATPTDAASGKIKVRVFYSKRVELIFNTTYRFPAAVSSP